MSINTSYIMPISLARKTRITAEEARKVSKVQSSDELLDYIYKNIRIGSAKGNRKYIFQFNDPLGEQAFSRQIDDIIQILLSDGYGIRKSKDSMEIEW